MRKKSNMKNESFAELKDILANKEFKKLFAGDTENTLIQLFRYLFVGGLATVADWGSSLLFFYIVFDRQYAVAANIIAFIFGLFANYFLSKIWVFKTSVIKSNIVEFLAFAAIGLVDVFLTAGITKLFKYILSSKTSMYQFIGKVTSTAVTFFWNFFARKFLLFNVKDTK